MPDKNNKNAKNATQTGASFSSDQIGENASEECPNKYSQKSAKSGDARGTGK